MTSTVAIPDRTARRLLDVLGPELRCSGVPELQACAADLVDALDRPAVVRVTADHVRHLRQTVAELTPGRSFRLSELQAALIEDLTPAGIDPRDQRIAAELILFCQVLVRFARHWTDHDLLATPVDLEGLLYVVALALADAVEPGR